VGRKTIKHATKQREIVDAQECITTAQGGYPDLIRSPDPTNLPAPAVIVPDAAIQCSRRERGTFFDRWETSRLYSPGLEPWVTLHPGGAATPDTGFT